MVGGTLGIWMGGFIADKQDIVRPARQIVDCPGDRFRRQPRIETFVPPSVDERLNRVDEHRPRHNKPDRFRLRVRACGIDRQIAKGDAENQANVHGLSDSRRKSYGGRPRN